MSTQTHPDRPITRRETIATAAGAATVALPASASVGVAQTDSGFVEIEVDATIPGGTSAEITGYEDEGGTGAPDRQQTSELSDGMNTYEYDALFGSVGQGIEYWFDLNLESDGDQQETPEINSMTITLPEDETEEEEEEEEEEPAEEAEGIFELWDNFLAFVAVSVLAAGLIGLASKSMAVASMGAFVVFAHIAVETGEPILENILYVALVTIFVGFAFKLWRLEGGGTQ